MTRALKEMPVLIIMWYHGLFGTISAAIYIIVEATLTDTGFRMLTYSNNLWWLIFLATVFNTFTTAFHTIAFQSDTSAFIVLLGNISVVFFFTCDTLVFKESFTKVELGGILIILTVVITVVTCKIREKNKKE